MEVVGAIIKNARNEYLLQKRDENAPTFKHHWTIFGGLIEEGEQPEEALLRELHEELLFDPQLIHSIKLIQTNTNDEGVVQYVFEVVTSVLIEDLVLSEGEAVEYIPEESVLDREFAFNIKEVFESYLKNNK